MEPLIVSEFRMQNALQFLRRMKFSRLDEFQRLHQQLRMPTLFIWGTNDPTFPVAWARRMALQFPNVSGFREVGDAKLFVHEERPEEVAELVASFLSQARS